MAEWTRGAKVGLFAVACAGAGYGLWNFVNPTAGTSGGYTVHAYLTDATGLATYSRVLTSGISIGSIETIRLEQGKARVDIKIKPDIVLYENADLAKRSSSLLGEFVVVIGAGDNSHRVLKNGDEITNVQEPISMDAILNDLGHVAGKVRIVTDSLANSVGSQQGEDNIRATLQNLAEVTEQLNGTIKENRTAINQIVTNVANISNRSDRQINQILENVRVITGEVRTMVAQEDGDLKGSMDSLRTTLEHTSRASADLQGAMRHLNNISARVDRGEGTLGRLATDETLINELENVIEGTADFVGGINRLQTIIGLRGDYNFQANTVKSYVELRLQPAEDKYYFIELINDPRGLTTVEQISVDTDNPNNPNHYREIRSITRNSMRFSFQFARRLGPITGRFGIKESTGGIGVNLHLLQDRFELQNDLFGFGEQLSPRLRTGLSYEFVRRLWLVTGVDDLFDRNRRDYFVGLQLRFVDDDLKGVLPFAPATF
ncbi:MAG: MlaD family protein [Polyangiaceae bacterium]|nr:MlaD family protein [Polyangiaceae bacterium]